MNILNHNPGYVYLLHFEAPIAPGVHTCQHYIGYARDFVNVAAALLDTDTEDLKERLKALGYTGIPGKPDERVKAYHALKDGATAQDALFGGTEQPVSDGTYSD